jgi:hypothetical protein
VLGVSRNHAHALLSRARDQLGISLGALLVARAGRADCAALNTLLEDWDGQLTVLMRKRINRHIEQCPECTERKRRELAPALLLGLAPLPVIVIAMPPGLRSQVLRLASSDTPEAVAHRAAVAQHATTFGQQGFPKPLDPPKPVWWRARQTQVAVAAVVVAAAAVLAILALAGGLGGHHGQLSALGQGSAGTGTGGASSGGTAPGTQPGSTGSSHPGGGHSSPGSPAQPAGPASGPAPASPSPSPSPGGTSPVPGGPSPSPSAPSSSHSPSPSSPAPSSSSATATATSTAPPTPPPATGTLSVTPRTIVVSALSGGSVTLTASGGPVQWSITESPGLVGELSVAPSSGRLLAGRSTTVTLSVSSTLGGILGARAAGGGGGGVCVGCQLTVNPGGIKVTVVLDISIAPSSPPPSSESPEAAAAAERPAARLVH